MKSIHSSIFNTLPSTSASAILALVIKTAGKLSCLDSKYFRIQSSDCCVKNTRRSLFPFPTILASLVSQLISFRLRDSASPIRIPVPSRTSTKTRKRNSFHFFIFVVSSKAWISSLVRNITSLFTLLGGRICFGLSVINLR